MTDSPDFRRWAESAHRDLMRPRRSAGRVHYSCTSCPHRISKNAARNNGYDCTHCGSPLKVKAQMVAQARKMAKILQTSDK